MRRGPPRAVTASNLAGHRGGPRRPRAVAARGEFPRAVRYCIVVADGSLHAITGTRPGAFSCFTEQKLGLLRSELDYAQVDAIIQSGLHEFFDSLQFKMNTIDECIFRDFFAQRPLSSATGA